MVVFIHSFCYEKLHLATCFVIVICTDKNTRRLSQTDIAKEAVRNGTINDGLIKKFIDPYIGMLLKLQNFWTVRGFVLCRLLWNDCNGIIDMISVDSINLCERDSAKQY